jgi:stress response protein SCP2/predicted Ser/Thr protein kinase
VALSKGQMLQGRYRIERLLSEGGMGAVYQAFDGNLEITVALKENFFGVEASKKQFKREALMLAKLHHLGLPRVTNHFEEDHRQYLVMDFVEGLDLWEMLKQVGAPLTQQVAIDYVVQLCDTLTYLHQQSPPIIHRDIKPQNIKITPDNRAILVDFGIAKEESNAQTVLGAKGVTPGFSPPEQYVGGTNPASDIYALGATLYTLVTAEMPQDSISLLTTGQKFPPANHINPKLSAEITEAIQWATNLKAEGRPQSAEEFKRRLLAISTGSSLKATRVLGNDEVIFAPAPPSPPTVTLKRGANVPLKSIDASLTQLLVRLGWDAGHQVGAELDIDAMGFMLTTQGTVRNDQDLVFYNNLKSPCGAVVHGGAVSAILVGEETIQIELAAVSAEIEKVIFTMSIYDAEARAQHFGMLKSAYICLVNQATGYELVRYQLSKVDNTETAMIFGQLYRYKDDWKFRAVGQGFKDGIEPLARHYGVSIGA